MGFSLRNNLTDTLCWNTFCPLPARPLVACQSKNLNAAYKQVMRNKGAAGIDRMDCARLLGYLLEHKERTDRAHPPKDIPS